MPPRFSGYCVSGAARRRARAARAREDIGMEVQMDEEEAAMKAADEMIEGFWRD